MWSDSPSDRVRQKVRQRPTSSDSVRQSDSLTVRQWSDSPTWYTPLTCHTSPTAVRQRPTAVRHYPSDSRPTAIRQHPTASDSRPTASDSPTARAQRQSRFAFCQAATIKSVAVASAFFSTPTCARWNRSEQRSWTSVTVVNVVRRHRLSVRSV